MMSFLELNFRYCAQCELLNLFIMRSGLYRTTCFPFSGLRPYFINTSYEVINYRILIYFTSYAKFIDFAAVVSLRARFACRENRRKLARSNIG